ncbi:hypothetical protein [Desertivirga brevis]|uniref:hypothetical protein n=1 Tax=Desertivirga brevis TaxID=2810310 RepID=UPI001A97B302|nr:hypothetical protein [Pedobacter sp. SYSU D00873]
MLRHGLYILFLSIFLLSCKENDTIVDTEDTLLSTKFNYRTLNLTVDSLQYNNPIQLDLNNDGVIDYVLSSVLIENDDLPYLYLYINRKTPNLNRIIVRQGEELPLNGLWAVPLDKDFLIQQNHSASLTWSASEIKTALLNVSETATTRTFGGEWLGKKDKYLGLQFLIDGKTHYGWLRISHNLNEAKLAIKDYAYNRNPGQPIKAGQM